MNTLARIESSRLLAVVTLAVLLSACPPSPAFAAVPEVVGVLAIVVEDEEVAEELKLTDQQREKLRELITAREDDALELVYLPPAERAEKLAAFRSESERRGLSLLSPPQRARLAQIRLRRRGLAALAEPGIAGRLGLTEAQQRRVAEVLKRRAGEGNRPGERTVYVETQRELFAMLSEQQRAVWEALTGRDLTALDEVAGAAATEPTAPALDQPPAAAEPIHQKQEEEPTGPIGVAEGQPAAPVDVVAEGPPTKPTTPGKLRFNFHFQPWKDVLNWFAEQADLSLELEAPPPGTFNYRDDREYSPTEAIDLLNSVLLVKGYTLVRRGRMLMLINLEDGIPPNLVSTIPLEELDQRGEFELVSVLFNLDRAKPEEIEAEISKLKGPQGSVATFPNARQILVTETAGRLRAIRAVIQRIEDPEGLSDGKMQTFDLHFAAPDELLAVVRQLFQIPEDQNATSDGSLRFAVDPTGERLLVTGKPEAVARLEEILKAVDVPGPGQTEPGQISGAPQLEVYSITGADPESVLAVMQTLLAEQPDVRLAIDPKTGNLAALARPAGHATIRATLEQLQRDARQVEVIYLHTVDPQLAVLAINKLFGGSGEKADPNAPQVDADPTGRQLLVRATPGQIEQIRTLLEKMGETDTKQRQSGSGNVRTLPLSGQAAQSALDRIQQIWPAMRSNPIRIVTPSAISPTMRSGQRMPAPRLPAPRRPPAATPGDRPPESSRPGPERPYPGRPYPGRPYPERRPDGSRPEYFRPQNRAPGMPMPRPYGTPPASDRSTQRAAGVRLFFASQTLPVQTPPAERPIDEPAAAEPKSEEADLGHSPSEKPTAEQPESTEPAPAGPEPERPEPEAPAREEPNPEGPGAEEPQQTEKTPEPAAIIVAPGPGGLMIASEDLEALDDFEELLTTLAGNITNTGAELTIFYLTHAKATAVAETIDQIFGGGTIAEESRGGGGLIGAALGDMGGGILGSLLGLGGAGGTIAPSGAVKITPDVRLNALFVQANPLDLDVIDQLVKILDQKESPQEILVTSKAKMIPVFNTQAEEIVEILKQVYQDRMVAGSRGGGRQGPSPEQIIQLLRGGRGSRGGSSRSRTEEKQKMSLGVDPRTNSVIVAAPEPLLNEVEQLVRQLDQAAVEANSQAMRVVTLRRASPETVQRALSAMMGEAVRSGGTGRTSSRPSSGGPPRPPGQPSAASSDARRAAFFEMMRQRFGGPPRGGGPPLRPGGGPSRSGPPPRR